MNNMDYLNQISADTRPAKQSTSFFDSLPIPANVIKFIGLAFIFVFLMLIIIAVIPSLIPDKRKDFLDRLYTRAYNVSTIIDENNSSIKSTRLRAICSNINSVLNTTQSSTFDVLIASYGTGSDNKRTYTVSEKLTASEDKYLEEIDTELSQAYITGNLDRTYYRTILRETGLIISLEDELLNRSDSLNNNYLNILTTSRSNLVALYTELQNFTDPTL